MKQVANVFYETCLVYKFYATLLTNKEEMQMMKSNRKSKNIILSWKPYQKMQNNPTTLLYQIHSFSAHLCGLKNMLAS
jgi:hypothetical protein